MEDSEKTEKVRDGTQGLRKPMILGLAVFCLLISVWALIQGFSGGKPHKDKKIHTTDGGGVAPFQALQELPETYTSDKMALFLASKPVEEGNNNGQLASLTEQLSQLQNNYQSLQQEFASFKENKTQPVEEPMPLQQQEDMTDIQKQRSRQSPMLIPVPTIFSDMGKKDKKESNRESEEGNANVAKIQYPKSKYELLAGSSIPAVLQTEIVSDSPGYVVGIVRQNVYDSIQGDHIIIPKGAKLIGAYQSNVTYGQGSLQVAFTRLIRPDGSSVDLSKFPGTGPLGTSGVGEELNNHWGSLLGSAALSTIFSIPSIMASNNQASYCYPDPRNPEKSICPGVGSIALNSLGRTAAQVGNKITDRALTLKPTVLVHPGYTFNILVTKDLLIPPYTK